MPIKTITINGNFISCCEDAATANASIERTNVVTKILNKLSNLKVGSSEIKSLYELNDKNKK